MEENKEEWGAQTGCNYKSVFEQPFWIQRISDFIVLDEPLRFSFFVYAGVTYALMFFLVNTFLGFLPWGMRDVLIDGGVAYLSAKYLSDLRIEGQSFVVAVFLFLVHYFKFEKSGNHFYYSGQFYKEDNERVMRNEKTK
ncbi:conjugal transfer protein [Lactococcus lactis]|uniref:Conjugal transfer protein n=1 Tax=Lactococcus lactis TaxID=1358 RepID=A0A9X4S4R0_9LACT|nr:TcpE family conjugal transfer membrane protein [Lactococcus lactis]MDG4983933.1 conjugal transfer protein [Lactococcus lactis]